jgi:hypothetical protein
MHFWPKEYDAGALK